MSRNPNPTIPPNFVTLRMLKELKEKREEEERLKREEEEMLKREEEERVRKLKEKEEQERIRKLREEEEYLKNRRKTIGSKKPYGSNFRRGAHPDSRLSGDVRSIPDIGTNGEAKAGNVGRSKPPRCPNLEAHMSRNGRSDLQEWAAVTDGGSDSKQLSLDELTKKKKKKIKKANWRKEKKASKDREGEMTKTPIGHNGFTGGAPMIEKGLEIPKVTGDVGGSSTIKVSSGERCRPVKVIGSEPCPIAEVKKGVSDLKMGEGNPNPNRRGRGRGYGGRSAEVKKGGSDLKMGEGNPNPNRRGRGRGYGGRSWGGERPSGSYGRGRGEGGMMWMKKTTES